MKLKIILVSALVVMTPALSHAISISSISDAISSNTTTQTRTTTVANNTAEQPVKPSEKTQQTKEMNFPNPALFIEDAAMTGYIHSQLLLKKNIPSVNISTENAVVSLSGTVDTQEQADTLVKVASSVKGVKYVNTDHLIVRERG